MTEIPMGQAPVEKDLVPLLSGAYAEAIYFNRAEKQVVCMSSQLSCAVGCKFCASPSDEKTTNLSDIDIMWQIDMMMDKYSQPDKITLFSFMGEGEPLLNYNNVLRVMQDKLPQRYSNYKISLSTSGVAPDKIKDLAKQEFEVPFKLQVSIHTLKPAVRAWFMPLAKSVEEIKEAIEFYHAAQPNRPVELNFALIKGLNDSEEDADLIEQYFSNEYIKISKYNPVVGFNFESPTEEEYIRFALNLRDRGMMVEYHETDGSKIGAACGQTRGLACGKTRGRK